MIGRPSTYRHVVAHMTASASASNGNCQRWENRRRAPPVYMASVPFPDPLTLRGSAPSSPPSSRKYVPHRLSATCHPLQLAEHAFASPDSASRHPSGVAAATAPRHDESGS
jgi:hypothetical protein